MIPELLRSLEEAKRNPGEVPRFAALLERLAVNPDTFVRQHPEALVMIWATARMAKTLPEIGPLAFSMSPKEVLPQLLVRKKIVLRPREGRFYLREAYYQSGEDSYTMWTDPGASLPMYLPDFLKEIKDSNIVLNRLAYQKLDVDGSATAKIAQAHREDKVSPGRGSVFGGRASRPSYHGPYGREPPLVEISLDAKDNRGVIEHLSKAKLARMLQWANGCE